MIQILPRPPDDVTARCGGGAGQTAGVDPWDDPNPSTTARRRHCAPWRPHRRGRPVNWSALSPKYQVTHLPHRLVSRLLFPPPDSPRLVAALRPCPLRNSPGSSNPSSSLVGGRPITVRSNLIPPSFSANYPRFFLLIFFRWSVGVRAGRRRCSSPATRRRGSGWTSAGGATRSATARCCSIRRARSDAGARPSASRIRPPRGSRSVHVSRHVEGWW
jgi:hypothetical protein